MIDGVLGKLAALEVAGEMEFPSSSNSSVDLLSFIGSSGNMFCEGSDLGMSCDEFDPRAAKFIGFWSTLGLLQ
jgi:hypothetical protein